MLYDKKSSKQMEIGHSTSKMKKTAGLISKFLILIYTLGKLIWIWIWTLGCKNAAKPKLVFNTLIFSVQYEYNQQKIPSSYLKKEMIFFKIVILDELWPNFIFF